jgi:DNA topoisomerase-1
MQIAQQLYEGVKIAGKEVGLITYMRTDSVNLSQKALSEASEFIKKNYGQEYSLPYPRQYKTRSKVAQEAHEAIRPTNFQMAPDKISRDLSQDQYKLYKLIFNRALASQCREAEIEKTNAEILAKDYTFSASGERLVFPGFIKIYGIQITSKELPEIKEGEELDLVELFKDQKFTEPPSRFSEASLIKTLEEQDIGRPSTYAPTISTIQDRGYVTLKAKYFYPEEIGILVINLLKKHFPEIVDLRFTAKMEDELDEIAQGKMQAKQVLSEFYTPFEKLLKIKEKELKKKDIAEEKTNIKCEKCGKYMVIKIGRYGKFLSCSDYPKCKFSKPLIDERAKIKDFNEDKSLAEATKEKCPDCGGALVLKEGRFGPFLACSKYPKCKFTKTVIKKIGMKCPDCKDGEVIERRTKKGKLFWGCTNYPKCKWASWEFPKKKLKNY